jgi:hypothetical protein
MIPTPLQHESLVASVAAKSASILSSMRAQFAYSRTPQQAASAVPDHNGEGDSYPNDDVVPDSDQDCPFSEPRAVSPKTVSFNAFPATEVPDETRALSFNSASDDDVFLLSDALESVSQPLPRTTERTLLNCAFLSSN